MLREMRRQSVSTSFVTRFGIALRIIGNVAKRVSRHVGSMQPDREVACIGAGLPEAFDLVPVPLAVVSGREIVHANPACITFLGYQNEKWITKPVTAVFPRLGGSGQLFPARALIVRRRDGSEFQATVTTSECVFNHAPALVAAIVERRDEDDLNRDRIELTHFSRVCALGKR